MKEEKPLLSIFAKTKVSPPPIWLMRQAGRYLPEYRELRAKAGSFWKMALTPALASEITLQPVRRFGFDAAIIFSDILTIPPALGVEVTIEEGIGPRMKPIASVSELVDDEARWSATMTPTYEALADVRSKLSPATTLIGFAGAPWTLATYLAQGQGSNDQRAAKLWGYRDPAGMDALLDRLAESVARHLAAQLDAGADVVQIFESWGSGLPDAMFTRWVIAPAKKIVTQLRAKHPKAKIIGFPRATTQSGYERYARETGVDVVSIDTATPIGWAAQNLAPHVGIQGNLDPIQLIAGGKTLDSAVDEILAATKDVPFIFNLGHGILQETPIAHVEQLVARVRGRR